ncbi:phosphoadenosine phosphosulfate reductase family protein [Kiloniella sp.]|uniref:phosphoadenosine phosphosulfate reductase domain-containing protein n=1 Tax=Kiloniella sp. TaxID=1938587 RepID=UPI003B028C7D
MKINALPREIKELRDRGALFVINHSGGKDSQAMTIYLRKHIADNQLLVVHAHLQDVEWAGTWDHVIANCEGIDCRQVVAKKTFFEMVRHRGRFPSIQFRQCTSDLKRSPIEKLIRHYLKGNPRFGGVVVNCMGMRAEESTRRSKQMHFRLVEGNCTRLRTWYNWLPIHQMLLDEVFDTINSVGQKAHWAYGEGMSRLSCCFCIMSSKQDLSTAAILNPDLYKRYVDLEKDLGHTLAMPVKGKSPRGLEEITGISV